MKVRKPVKTAIGLIVFAVCLNAAVNHLDVVGRMIGRFFGLLSPILIGFLLAFLLSISKSGSSSRMESTRCVSRRQCSGLLALC